MNLDKIMEDSDQKKFKEKLERYICSDLITIESQYLQSKPDIKEIKNNIDILKKALIDKTNQQIHFLYLPLIYHNIFDKNIGFWASKDNDIFKKYSETIIKNELLEIINDYISGQLKKIGKSVTDFDFKIEDIKRIGNPTYAITALKTNPDFKTKSNPNSWNIEYIDYDSINKKKPIKSSGLNDCPRFANLIYQMLNMDIKPNKFNSNNKYWFNIKLRENSQLFSKYVQDNPEYIFELVQLLDLKSIEYFKDKIIKPIMSVEIEKISNLNNPER